MLVDLQRAAVGILDKIEANTRAGAAAEGVTIEMQNYFGSDMGQAAVDQTIDELEEKLDQVLGHRLDLQHIHVGSVGR